MEIQPYRPIELGEILPLYKRAGWTNYVKNPEMLQKAYENSLLVLAARQEKQLIGLVRVVGDGASILYIQDILVLPEYQGEGVGSRLLQEVDRLYPQVYQKVLLTDQQPNTMRFYEKCGYRQSDEFGCTAYMKINF